MAPSESSARSALMTLAFLLPLVAAALAAMGFRGRDILLGIDLGTTFSTIAYREGGKVEVLKLADGRDACWSAIAVVGNGFVVGEAARAIARSHPEVTIFDAKRVIGRSINDPMVSSEAVRHHGRLVEHPLIQRSPLQGRAIASGGITGMHAKPCPECRPDLAFAIPLHDQSGADRSKLTSHKCVDPGSLVDVQHSAAPAAVRDLASRPRTLGGTDSDADSSGRGLQSHARVHGARYYLLLTPQAVACVVIDHLLSAARANISRYRTFKAMVCVPAEFAHSQRQATLDAFGKAGVTVVRTLHEPTAAAIAYGLHKRPDVHYVLVFDMGGGTLDVSVLFLSSGAFTVIGAAGDNALGGEDVDDCVVGIMRSQLDAVSSVGDGCTQERLKAEAERVKIGLSGDGGVGAQDSVSWSCDGRAAGEGGVAPLLITRPSFESTCSPLFDRSILPVQSALEAAAVSSEEVDEVVLVGGSSRLPAVRARLASFFGERLALHSTVDPDLAVALGAAGSGD